MGADSAAGAASGTVTRPAVTDRSVAEAATTTTSRTATNQMAIARLRPDVLVRVVPVVRAAPVVAAVDAGVGAVAPARNCSNS